jgi:preprotein translocase subunit SecE
VGGLLPQARLTLGRRQPIWLEPKTLKDRTIVMAKTSPAEFINQVRAEARKIVWPTGRETVQTTIMVIIMMTILSLFFFGVDTVFNAIVSWLTSLAR